ncbi:glycosyltransferase family 2 protein [Bacillus sp. OTU530]|uniref:glycosyltransferase family 2 protein n=1 Tax=Bacillus sp. OTU530 TaxID=3043862 RepID=UPI00313F021E
MNIVALMSCFNRKDKTEQCIKDLVNGNKNINFTFVVVDDNSNDGTDKMLKDFSKVHDVRVIRTEGDCYYSGGMRIGMQYILDNLNKDYDGLLLVNDDVQFFDNCIEKMYRDLVKNKNRVIVGTTCDKNRALTYGAIKYRKSIKYKTLEISESHIQANTFNANCVLMDFNVLYDVGIYDKVYIHSLGDFDYGMMLSKAGYEISSTNEYIGICEKNSTNNTWLDMSLSKVTRLKLKESPKGAPLKPWFHYLYKHFGLSIAIRGAVTPYIRIIFSKERI